MKLGKLMKHIDGNTYVTIRETHGSCNTTHILCQKCIFVDSLLYHRKVKEVKPSTYYFSQREPVECLLITIESEKQYD